MQRALLRQVGSRLQGGGPAAAALGFLEAATGAPSASAAKAAEAARAAADPAWVSGATPLSQAAAAPASQPRQLRRPRRLQREEREEEYEVDARLLRMLGPRRLAAALGAARSFRGAARLLLAHRDVVTSAHMLAAAARMGELAAAAGRAPTPDEHDAFSGAVELALELMQQEGRELGLREAAALLDAAAAVQHPLAPSQMAAVEAAAARGIATDSTARHENRLLCALLCLGAQPGEQLAAALAPACCRGESEEEGRATFVPLDAEQLEIQLRLADEAGLRRLLRLLALHSPDLSLRHLLAALRALGQLVAEKPQRRERHLQRAFAALRARALAELAAGPEDALDMPTVARLLDVSADLRVPPSAAEQAALEAAVLRGLGEARVADLHPILAAYDRLDLQPGSAELGAALHQAAEWLLHAASPLQLRDSLAAWRGRGWAVTAPLAAAAEARALQHLRSDDTSADGVAQLLQAFTAADGGFAPSQQLVGALRGAVLRHLASPLAADPPTDFASAALSCCRKLGMLPDRDLLAAFVGVAPRVLAGASEPAFAYAPRLLMAMQLQGWHYSTATSAVQRTMQALLQKMALEQATIAMEPARSVEELVLSLGLICHGLHLLAGVGLRPSDAHLRVVGRHLRRHQRQLTRRQRDWLRGALEAWQLGDLGMTALRERER